MSLFLFRRGEKVMLRYVPEHLRDKISGVPPLEVYYAVKCGHMIDKNGTKPSHD